MYWLKHTIYPTDLDKPNAGSVLAIADERELTLQQAARDGVQSAVARCLGQDPNSVNRTDRRGMAALHYAARNGHRGIVAVLLDHGADVGCQNSEKQTPLHLAAKCGKVDCLVLLLTRGASPEVLDARGKTAMHLAARRGRVESLEALLRNGVEVNCRDGQLMTPLHDAVLSGSEQACALLISQGANVNLKDVSLRTPLMMASAEGFVGIMDALLGKASSSPFEDLNSHLNAQDDEGATAIHAAVQNGFLSALKCLKKFGASWEIKKLTGETGLHLAAIGNNADIVSYLIENGAIIEARDNGGRTPLHRAALLDRLECASILISKGANIEAIDSARMTPLLCAASKGHLEILQYLLDLGASGAAVDSSLNTALHLAVAVKSSECVRRLIEAPKTAEAKDQLVNAKDVRDQTAAHVCAKVGDGASLALLIGAGAKLAAKDDEEKAALHVAAENGQSDCVKALLKVSLSELNDADHDGRTPLMLAVAKGHIKAVDLLLAEGGNVATRDHRDDNKQTALSIACSSGYKDIVQLLLDNNVDMAATDNRRDTALHVACAKNHADIVLLLLNNKADVSARNFEDQTPFNIAIERGAVEAARTIAVHELWAPAMDATDKDGFTPMRQLIEKMPSVAKIIMDKCVIHSFPEDHLEHKITYIYKYIDPHPDAPCCTKQKQWFITTMLENDRQELVWHPLSQASIECKWKKFGKIRFAVSFVTFIMFLVMLTTYTLMSPRIAGNPLDSDNCPIMTSNSTESSAGSGGDQMPPNGGDPMMGSNSTDPAFGAGPAPAASPTVAAAATPAAGPSGAAPAAAPSSATGGAPASTTSAVVGPPAAASSSSPAAATVSSATSGLLSSSSNSNANANPSSGSSSSLAATATVSSSSSSSSANSNSSGGHEMMMKKTRLSDMMSTDKQGGLLFIQAAVTSIMLVFALQQFIMALYLRRRFFRRLSSYASLILIVSSGMFCWPGSSPCLAEWRCGWLANFLGWMFLFEYLMSFKMTGILIMMLQTVSFSLIKVMVLLLLFLVAFGATFNILIETTDGFATIYDSPATVFSMAVGEINYVDRFVGTTNNFATDATIMSLLFIFCVPILFMNLTIGIAVDDIDGIRKISALKQLESQAFYIYDFEVTAARRLQRRWYTTSTSIMPNLKKSILHRKSKHISKSQPGTNGESAATLSNLAEQVTIMQKMLVQIETGLQDALSIRGNASAANTL